MTLGTDSPARELPIAAMAVMRTALALAAAAARTPRFECAVTASYEDDDGGTGELLGAVEDPIAGGEPVSRPAGDEDRAA